MKKTTTVLAALFLSCCGIQAQGGKSASMTFLRPRLVVGIVIDQMRWDYLYRYQQRYTEGGFKRLLTEGYSCENTRLPYIPSVTAIGHTCIYTGSVPTIHGIAGNNFYKDGKKVYCTDDPSVRPVGTTAKSAQMSPCNLWVTTIGDEMKLATNGRSKVVGVSLKDRASILPAGQNPDGAYWFDDQTGNFVTSSYYMDKLPEWVVSFNKEKHAAKYLSNKWQTLYPDDSYTESTADATDYEDGKFLIMVTKNGKIKRTPLSAYKNVRKNGLRAVGLDDGDEIAGVRLTDGSAQVIVATRNGYAIRIDETQMRPMSRTAHGVKAIKLRDGDYVVSMARVREGASVLTVTDKGLGRRVKLDDYRIQNRGGYGMLNYKVSDDKGYVCGIKIVDEEDDIIMIATDGVIIRIRACDIRIMGRYATGVKLMRVSGEDRVVAFTRAEHDDSAETEKIEQPSEEELEKEMAEAAAEEQNEVVIDEAPDDDEDEQEDTEE